MIEGNPSIPRRPVIPPEVWYFVLEYFGGVKTFSEECHPAPNNSRPSFKKIANCHDPARNKKAFWHVILPWCWHLGRGPLNSRDGTLLSHEGRWNFEDSTSIVKSY